MKYRPRLVRQIEAGVTEFELTTFMRGQRAFSPIRYQISYHGFHFDRDVCCRRNSRRIRVR